MCRDDVQKLAVVITDGRANERLAEFEREANALKDIAR